MSDIEFSKSLIKGRIAEIVFEQMFRTTNKFSIFHFGYEYTLPELAQYQHLTQVKAVTDNIKDAPDFVLISKEKEEVYLVEVKYRHYPSKKDNLKLARALLKRWNPAYLFVASPEGFFFGPCNTIVTNKGEIGSLFTKWASQKDQNEYLQLLKEFELGH
ncbi:MAG: hypothetical protein KKA07_02940 [Bacteroidetes bacterium]|nr:hypothetical protein [Bacteroidota bacterium]MBU1718007.1 hypothetical protein [Bacteroidota bacterium]